MESIRRSFSNDQQESPQSQESQPLMRPMATAKVGSLCYCAVVAGLVVLWCIVDQWNRSVSDTLFSLHNVEVATIDEKLAKQGMQILRTSKPFPNFSFPLFLAFVQFTFMGLIFLALFWFVFREDAFTWKEANQHVFRDRRWPALVLTHIFSTFWLQALMMPTHAGSLAIFAATRAAEIPATALLRGPLGAQLGQKPVQTSALACAAAAVLYYAYAQVAECLCVWSGHGVTLFGGAFLIAYGLVLLVPAANLVLQESVLQQRNMHPLFMLGVMNLFASLVFLPVLLFAHMTGLEDVSGAVAATLRFNEVSMLVAWLSFQMALISIVTVGVIVMTDSFWAVAIRALRVLYWWVQQLFLFYAGAAFAGANISVSVACPHSSKWSFVMLCGVVLAVLAILTDRRNEDAAAVKANQLSSKLKAGP